MKLVYVNRKRNVPSSFIFFYYYYYFFCEETFVKVLDSFFKESEQS